MNPFVTSSAIPLTHVPSNLSIFQSDCATILASDTDPLVDVRNMNCKFVFPFCRKITPFDASKYPWSTVVLATPAHITPVSAMNCDIPGSYGEYW